LTKRKIAAVKGVIYFFIVPYLDGNPWKILHLNKKYADGYFYVNSQPYYKSNFTAMPSNPFDAFFEIPGNPGEKKDLPEQETAFSPQEDRGIFPEHGKESLDEIMEKNTVFERLAESFSKLLSQTKAIDHEPVAFAGNTLVQYFVQVHDPHDQRSMRGEKAYHQMLENKFRTIAVPMLELAKLHSEIAHQFIADVDEHYYSVEKTDREVKSDKELALDGLLFQRKLLGNAARDLGILTQALEVCEVRLAKYIDAGGDDNISRAEQALMAKSRIYLTSGQEHSFDYGLFALNLLDEAALTFRFFTKQTLSQYIQRLESALRNKK